MPNKTQQKHGILKSFNVSPKGSYEGLLLENRGELMQINFPQDWSAVITGLAKTGEKIEMEVEPYETRHAIGADHPVYSLVSLRNGLGESFPPGKRDLPADGHFSGTVASLNYALHGEVNGAILDTGDFLHLKPHGAATLGLAAGMKVKGVAEAKPMIGGHAVLEAIEVNGVNIDSKPKPKKKAHV